MDIQENFNLEKLNKKKNNGEIDHIYCLEGMIL